MMAQTPITPPASYPPLGTYTHTLWQGTRLFWLGLLLWQVVWHLWLSPHPHLPAWAVTLGWSAPLLFPLRGLFQGRPYTHAWANFVLMLYFLHALTIITIDEGERWLGIVELILTSGSFTLNLLYARKRGQELGLKLRKLKAE